MIIILEIKDLRQDTEGAKKFIYSSLFSQQPTGRPQGLFAFSRQIQSPLQIADRLCVYLYNLESQTGIITEINLPLFIFPLFSSFYFTETSKSLSAVSTISSYCHKPSHQPVFLIASSPCKAPKIAPTIEAVVSASPP